MGHQIYAAQAPHVLPSQPQCVGIGRDVIVERHPIRLNIRHFGFRPQEPRIRRQVNVTQHAAAVRRKPYEVSTVLHPQRGINGMASAGTHDHGAADAGVLNRAHVRPQNRSSEIQVIP